MGHEHRKYSISFLVYPVPKYLRNPPQRHRGATLWWHTTFLWALRCALGSEQDFQSMKLSSSLSFHGDAVPWWTSGPQGQLRTKPTQLTFAHLAGIAGALCGQAHRNPLKKGETARKKSVTQFRRGSECLTWHQLVHKYRVSSSSGAPTEDAEQLPGTGDKEWHKEQEQHSQSCSCPALGRSQLFSPWGKAQALGWAQVMLAKPGLWFGSLAVPFTRWSNPEYSVNSMKVSCQGGMESPSLWVSKRGLAMAMGMWIWGDHGPAGLMLGLRDLEGLFQPWWLCAQIWAPITKQRECNEADLKR